MTTDPPVAHRRSQLTPRPPRSAVVVTAAPAQAAPPVVVNDTTSMYAGNGREVDVAGQRHRRRQPDDLAVCRLGDETYKRGLRGRLRRRRDLHVLAPRRQARHLHVHLLRLRLPDAGARHAHRDHRAGARGHGQGPAGSARQDQGDEPGGLQDPLPLRLLQGAGARRHRSRSPRTARSSSACAAPRSTGSPTRARATSSRRAGSRTSCCRPGTTPPAAGRSVSPRVAKLWSSAV